MVVSEVYQDHSRIQEAGAVVGEHERSLSYISFYERPVELLGWHELAFQDTFMTTYEL